MQEGAQVITEDREQTLRGTDSLCMGNISGEVTEKPMWSINLHRERSILWRSIGGTSSKYTWNAMDECSVSRIDAYSKCKRANTVRHGKKVVNGKTVNWYKSTSDKT